MVLPELNSALVQKDEHRDSGPTLMVIMLLQLLSQCQQILSKFLRQKAKLAAGSQSNTDHVITKIKDHHRAFNAMIVIFDPDFRKQLPGSDDLMSDAETEEGNEADDTQSHR
ncbi:hypothetical protein GUJ93_ZPchr0006g44997 [Zizania palustris]|uniref:Uncharacterized protein n=1 Tax=Zizania palustris TaxID=103762 RepID=A0A8J5SXD9_ZIZPA|nr:hypothetical protein GUJ93_ZPchr0006g44997 [Zizania palustris]